MTKNILFDLDGTLTDPAQGITKCICYALEKMGRPSPPASDLHWCIGPPLSSSFATLLKTTDEALIQQSVDFYRERYAGTGIFENEMILGISEMLSALRETKLRLFVATSKPTVFAVQVIQHFGFSEFFEHVYGAELDGTNSYKPDLLKFILDESNLNPQETIMIGDRHYDIEGAKANDVTSIAVSWGYGSKAEFEKAEPDYLCHYPAEILTVLGVEKS